MQDSPLATPPPETSLETHRRWHCTARGLTCHNAAAYASDSQPERASKRLRLVRLGIPVLRHGDL